MEMIVDFPGNAKVDAHFGPYTVQTDQSKEDGGDGSAPSPLLMFLSSIGTCAGIYALRFCQKRGISTKGLRIVQRMSSNQATGMVEKVELQLELPENFPMKYQDAIISAVGLCSVKKHLHAPPTFEIVTK